jgi:murein DD-endopeptidase MepM/ murein hydrolase activator NlpD
MDTKKFDERIRESGLQFKPVVPFEKGDGLVLLDFTEKNSELTSDILADNDLFIKYINRQLTNAGAKYGIGGYAEHRTIYSRSRVFDAKEGDEPRRLHLGIDIWGKPYTKVMAPMNGIVHSFGFNNAFGDYGTTIILSHQLEGFHFYTLYGHLSLNSIQNMEEGDVVKAGDVFAQFGIPFENGHWPPHLHFQIILDMQGRKGDYPGVCKYSERQFYLANCPNPDLILAMMKYLG